MLISKIVPNTSATLLGSAVRVGFATATFTLMSQFEDPSAHTSVDPYSDAYTQPVALSRDQEPNPRRSHSPSREHPASYNRPSTPPKRPAHAPIVSYRGAATLDCLSTYLSGSEPM